MTLKSSEGDIDFLYDPDPRTPSTGLNASLFRNIDFTGLPLRWDGRLAKPWSSRVLARNKITNVIPSIVHFNLLGGDHPLGNKKLFLKYWWSLMWFSQKEELPQLIEQLKVSSHNPGGSGAWYGNRWIGVSELCHHLMGDH